MTEINPGTPARQEISGEAACAIRLVSLDVDGVLTDGSVWVLSGAESAESELRRFHVLDGMGIRLLQQAGVEVGFVSGKRSSAVAARAAELGVEHVSLGDPRGKVLALAGILSRRDWAWENVAHLGDDLADLAVMARVGIAGAVVSAVAEVRARAHWVGTVPAGSGAVREFVEALLTARGQWAGLIEDFDEGGRFGGGSLEAESGEKKDVT